MDRPKVLVAGATGYLGRYVVKALHREGYPVRAFVRDERRLGDARACCAEVFVGEATRSETLAGLCDGVDVVFSSLGKRDLRRRPTVWQVDCEANLNLLRRARESGVGDFVFISATHADVLRQRGVVLAEARERVVDALRASGLAWTVLRPSGFFNDMTEMFEMARRGTGWVFGDGGTGLNPIHGADLAEEVVRCIGDPSLRGQAISRGGPDYLTMRQILELAFEALGKPPRIRSVPRWMLHAARVLARPINPMVAALMQAIDAAMDLEDTRAPACGTHHLRDYFQELARAQAPGG